MVLDARRRRAPASTASWLTLRDSLEESKSENYRDWLLNYMSATTCPACKGKRLRPESLAVKVGSLSIADFTALPLRKALDAAGAIEFSPP